MPSLASSAAIRPFSASFSSRVVHQTADLVEKPIVGLGHLKTLRSLQIDRHR
jgi:hypothetical protein